MQDIKVLPNLPFSNDTFGTGYIWPCFKKPGLSYFDWTSSLIHNHLYSKQGTHCGSTKDFEVSLILSEAWTIYSTDKIKIIQAFNLSIMSFKWINHSVFVCATKTMIIARYVY